MSNASLARFILSVPPNDQHFHQTYSLGFWGKFYFERRGLLVSWINGHKGKRCRPSQTLSDESRKW